MPHSTLDPPRRSPDAIRVVLAAASGSCVAGMLLVRLLGLGPCANPLLAIGSTCYVLIALRGGALRSRYGRRILIGLLLCWVGDVVGPGHFLLGLWAFLLAHFGLMAGFWARGLQAKRVLGALIIVLSVSGALSVWFYPHVPASERVPIFVYTAVVSAMLVLAGGASGGRGGTLVLLAATAFYVSDVLLARSRFVAHEFINTAIGYPLYYTACILLAYSVSSVDSRTADDAGSA